MDAPPRPILGCILLLLAFMVVMILRQSEPYGEEYKAAFYVLIIGVLLLLLLGAVRLYEIMDKTALKEAQSDCKTVPSIKLSTCPEYMIMDKIGTQTVCSNKIGDNTYLVGDSNISETTPLTTLAQNFDLDNFNRLGDNRSKCLESLLDSQYKRYSWTDRMNRCIGVS